MPEQVEQINTKKGAITVYMVPFSWQSKHDLFSWIWRNASIGVYLFIFTNLNNSSQGFWGFGVLGFANSDIATEFKDTYEKYQKEMESLLAGEDKPDASGEADEAAEALSGLKTGDDE